MSRALPALALLLAVSVPASVLADVKAELSRAFDRFLEAPSFRATMSDAKTGKRYVSVEYAAPDRYRIVNEQGGPTMVVVGNTAQMDVGGRMMSVPVPINQIVSAYRNEEMLRKQRETMTVEVLPDGEVDGRPAKVYRFTAQHPRPSTATAWVGEGDTLLQIEVDGGSTARGKVVRVRYSDLGADIRIP
ncbi:MAG: hypothetical protein KatS3mg127_1340 [Silanimonas sp.]|nr:MAG: hypothetical protein KatS3mg127_1340 [Silanimonas sp.]